MDPRNKQGRHAGGGRAAGAPSARARSDPSRDAPKIAGAMSAMRLRPDLDPERPGPGGRRASADGGAASAGEMPGALPGEMPDEMPGGMPGERSGEQAGGMPGERASAADPLPRFGGRLAGLGPLGAPAAGEMPAGDMNGGLAALLDDAGSGASALDQPPADGGAMPAGAMDDAGREAASQAMHSAMNEGHVGMPTGAMSNGDGGEMPHAGSLRRREDPDAGGEVRRREDPDAGGELAAGPADAGAGGMPTADMHRASGPAAATSPDAAGAAGAATSLAIGGEWRLTLSSISLGRG